MQAPDVSIVLNLHDEASYLGRTLGSLVEAVEYARISGKRFELIAVLDRATPATKRQIQTADLSAFDQATIIEVDNGSLGLSRNDGVKVASGTYICTADGDDLISFNFFTECLAVIASNSEAIVVPEFLYAFGTRYHFWQYFGKDRIPAISLSGYHPYISRILANREFFEQNQYIEIVRNPHFSYEDWHINCQAAAERREFKTAPNTILFYRQRSGSIMATEGNRKTVPYSRYFSRSTFLQNFSDDYHDRAAGKKPVNLQPELIRQYGLQSKVIAELLYAANRIEPGIDYDHLRYMEVGSNAEGTLHYAIDFGAAYYEALSGIGDESVTDVFLLPFLSKGGAEKYFLNIMRGLCELDPQRRILILSGEKFERHVGVEALPDNITFLDLWAICHKYGADIHQLTLRIVQACAATAIIHIHSSDYSQKFILDYKNALSLNRLVYYFFSAARLQHEGMFFTYGTSHNFLSETSRHLSLVVTDHEASSKALAQMFELDPGHMAVLYSKTDVDLNRQHTTRTISNGELKLLWASRFDGEKRPDIVLKIAQRARERGLRVTIDMYGSSVFGKHRPADFNKLPDVRYKGPFENFSKLPITEFNAFLYTSAFDGLPNVVLESIANGLPVIAVDVGGISEIIGPETGMLIPNNADDDLLVNSYVDAMTRIAQGEIDLDALAARASAMLKSRHTQAAYLKQLATIFSMAKPASV